MLPAVNEPVHLIDADGLQAPGIVVPAQRPDLVAVRVDGGPSARVGAAVALTWNVGDDVFQVEAVVERRSLVDGVPAVDLEPRGEIVKVQRRRYVRVPVQRPIVVELDPLPFEPAGSVSRASGLTLDIAEASVCCSISERHADVFTLNTAVRVAFDLDGVDYALRGEIAQVRQISDAETPRVELVVMLDVGESERTTLRRALFAEQIKMRSRV